MLKISKMTLPENVNKVTRTNSKCRIFPPVGFLEFEEANDGAGDNYGLYWEFGKENSEPIICSKRHEEFLLIPEFSNLDSFLGWFEETGGQKCPSLDLKDTSFYINLFLRSKVSSKNGKIVEAIKALEKSIELFAEYSDSWTLLAENYYKTNDIEKGDLASVNSIITNYAFGLPSKKCIEQFNKIDSSGKLKNNPLLKRQDSLLQGGDYLNPFVINYDQLIEAINEFKELKDYRSALILEQNYGYLMHLEQSDVKIKYNFEDEKWSAYFSNEIYQRFPDRIL